MKYIIGLIVWTSVASICNGQTSLAEKTGFWISGSSWVGGTMPGSLASGTITVGSKTVVINGTIKSKDNLALNFSTLSINAGDTLVILGDLNVNLTTLSNNGVLIVFGNVTNALSNNSISGTGKLVVTGNYTNAFGSNTFSGPSYVYGSTPGFIVAPAVGDEGDLQTNDPGLYNYTNSIYGSLPVELISFSAKVVDYQVEVTWATASELNNHHFLLERSTDGVNFTALTTTPGAGTSSQGKEYKAHDDYPPIGLAYYRLTQVDYDGKYEVFKVISVFVDEPDEPEVYPNPTTDYILVDVNPENYSTSLSNLNGRVVTDNIGKSEFEGRLRLDLQALQPGVYVLQLLRISTAVRLQYRIIKQ